MGADAKRRNAPARSASSRTLHIIVPNLLSRSGHNYQVTVGMRRAALDRGWTCDIHLPRQVADETIVRELGARCSIDHVAEKAFPNVIADIGGANYQFYLDFKKIAENVDDGDIIYLAMVHHRNLFGLMRALDELKDEGRLPIVAAQLWSQQCFVDGTGEIHRRNSEMFSEFFSWCRMNRGKCSRMFAFAPPHVEHLLDLGADPGWLMPFPHVMAPIPDRVVPELSPAGSIRYGYFGSSVNEWKGLDQMLGAARLIAAARPDAAFKIQLEVSEATYDVRALLDRHQDVLHDPRVRILPGNLSTERYFAELSGSDVVVLPYGPLYERQESGILHEAVHFGKPVVVPEKSLANGRLKHHGLHLPAFSRWSPEAIADACLKAGRQYHELSRAMSAAAAGFNRGFTADNVVELIGVARVPPLQSVSPMV